MQFIWTKEGWAELEKDGYANTQVGLTIDKYYDKAGWNSRIVFRTEPVLIPTKSEIGRAD